MGSWEELQWGRVFSLVRDVLMMGCLLPRPRQISHCGRLEAAFVEPL